ncbi:MAG: DUF5642 family protein [Mycobacterium sp.]
MRPFWIGTAVLLLAAACARSPGPSPSGSPAGSASPAPNIAVNPANIKKVVRELPSGYEVSTGIPDGASPRVIWNLTAEPTAKPPQCAALGDPGNGRDHSAQGVSGSGSGGIVDAVLVAFPALPEPVDLDHNVVASCGQWTMTAAHTTVSVRLIDPPHIDGTDTVGMVADIKTSVESGTEIDSRAYTFTAYLGNYYAFTTVITDPGSVLPALTPQFAADLLVKTVSTLRS